MSRKSPTLSVLRALFIKSGNQCAFPGCANPLVNEKNQFIAQVCHIEAAKPGGKRFNPCQSDEERRGYENLIILCYPHHVETNDVDSFSVEQMREMKKKHEASYQERDFNIDEDLLKDLVSEMNEYWTKVETLNTVAHICSDFAIGINTEGGFGEVMKEVHKLVDDLEAANNNLKESDELIMSDLLNFLHEIGIDTRKVENAKYYENPLISRNWETHNLSLPNYFSRLHVSLMHLELKYLETHVWRNPDDKDAKNQLDLLRGKFKKIAQTASIVD